MNAQAIVIDAVICCVIGAGIGSSKGQGGAGFWLGLLFGPIGLILCLTMKPTPAVAAARLEAIEAERAKIRAQQAGTVDVAGTSASSSDT
ncbi:MAG: hypothetical protein YHS30scaffold324_55 [Catenulispora phage 69_17]|nr:MAG: hypothetical protein YHS30scaffold324_55 [Catenulispora phage 69_17]